MKRHLFWANLALLTVCVAGVVHLRRQWVSTSAGEQAVLQARLRLAPPPHLPPAPVVEPVKAAGYGDIAQKMLFSKDRNPTVVVEPPPPPKAIPMPALPLFHGVVDLGDGPMAILSEGPKGPHRDYQAGDNVGAFKIVSVNDEELVLEWDGQTITKRVEDILDRGAPAPAAPGPVVAAKPAAPPPVVTRAPAAPGGELSPGIRACQPGDRSPAGTVADGMRKVLKPTPFGSRCYWVSEK